MIARVVLSNVLLKAFAKISWFNAGNNLFVI